MRLIHIENSSGAKLEIHFIIKISRILFANISAARLSCYSAFLDQWESMGTGKANANVAGNTAMD